MPARARVQPTAASARARAQSPRVQLGAPETHLERRVQAARRCHAVQRHRGRARHAPEVRGREQDVVRGAAALAAARALKLERLAPREQQVVARDVLDVWHRRGRSWRAAAAAAALGRCVSGARVSPRENAPRHPRVAECTRAHTPATSTSRSFCSVTGCAASFSDSVYLPSATRRAGGLPYGKWISASRARTPRSPAPRASLAPPQPPCERTYGHIRSDQIISLVTPHVARDQRAQRPDAHAHTRPPARNKQPNEQKMSPRAYAFATTAVAPCPPVAAASAPSPAPTACGRIRRAGPHARTLGNAARAYGKSIPQTHAHGTCVAAALARTCMRRAAATTTLHSCPASS